MRFSSSRCRIPTVLAGMVRQNAALLALLVLVAAEPHLAAAQDEGGPPDLIVHGAEVTTLWDERPEAEAVAVRDGLALAVGTDEEVLALCGPETEVLDAAGRRLIPGLIDSHMHPTRGGRFYAAELRWDGVPLARARPCDDPRAGRADPRGRVGARGRWLEPVPVRGGPDADAGRAHRGRPRHPRLRPLPLQPGLPQRCWRRSPRLE